MNDLKYYLEAYWHQDCGDDWENVKEIGGGSIECFEEFVGAIEQFVREPSDLAQRMLAVRQAVWIVLPEGAMGVLGWLSKLAGMAQSHIIALAAKAPVAAPTITQRLAIALHTATCRLDHDHDVPPPASECGWHFEVHASAHDWSAPAHKHHLGRAERLLANVSAVEPDTLVQVVEVLGQLR